MTERTTSSPSGDGDGGDGDDFGLTVPEATPAAPDLVCWIWAAVPPKGGRIHVARAAAAFGVSSSTLRRWLADAEDREFTQAGLRRATQLAILRGKGQLLWPNLEASSRARAVGKRRTAMLAMDVLTDPSRIPAEWSRDGRLGPHQVLLVEYPRAHVYTLTATRETKTRRRLEAAGGQILTEVTVANRFEADLSKHAALAAVDAYRCVAPRSLVPIGRTDCWRAASGYWPVLLQLWQQVGNPGVVDSSTAEAITGLSVAELSELATSGAVPCLRTSRGTLWPRSVLEEVGLAAFRRTSRPRGGGKRNVSGEPEKSAGSGSYWVTMSEAARVLGISPHQVQRLRSSGQLPARRAGNGWWLARRDDLRGELQA